MVNPNKSDYSAIPRKIVNYEGEEYALRYLRTKEHKEVDFALVKERKMEKMIEVKWTNDSVGQGISYFHNKYHFPAIQVVKNLKREKKEKEILIVDGQSFLTNLDL